MKNNRIQHHRLQQERGQNVIEYLLVTVAFVLVCVIFFHPASSPGKNKMENVINHTVLGINTLRNQIQF